MVCSCIWWIFNKALGKIIPTPCSMRSFATTELCTQ
jgi:hypothetical protein